MVDNQIIIENGIPRKEFISKINISSRILEIGPYFNPLVNIDICTHYRSLDVFTYEQLIKRTKEKNKPFINKIVKPDYIIDTSSDYKSVINENFDLGISSNNITYPPCLVKFLNNISSVLIDEGKLFLIIPDKRYCYDHYRNCSTIAEILEAFYEKRIDTSFRNYFDFFINRTDNIPEKHWANEFTPKHNYESLNRTDIDSIYQCCSNFEGILNWCFTPESFLEIINFLYKHQYINMKVVNIYNTLPNTFEFMCILQKNEW